MAQVCSGQVECSGVSAQRMWEGAVKEGHVWLPKALPNAISHVSYEGPRDPPSAGLSCRTIHFHPSYAEAVAKERHSENVVLLVKEKLEEMDGEARKVKVEMVEGGILGTAVKSAKQSVHIQDGAASSSSSCVVHWSFEYEPLSEQHASRVPPLVNDYIPRGYKKMAEYLLAHDGDSKH